MAEEEQGANLTIEEVFKRMKELNANNPNMLIWIAGYELAQRAEPVDHGDLPYPENDLMLQGYLLEREDEQYLADIEMPSKYLEENRHTPPAERLPYEKWIEKHHG